MAVAKRSKQMMIVEFHEEGVARAQDPLVNTLAANAELAKLAGGYVLVRIPVSETAEIDGKQMRLIQHEAFADLGGQPGLAMIDFRDSEKAYYECVVSIYPFQLADAYAVRKLAVLLDLPPGTLTQRTLILAVRTHPEGPESADGVFLTQLAAESESHSEYQAQLGRQGHQHWESRFHRINRFLPRGLLSREVVAESWPGQGLLAAAFECVHSWRQSSGHWNAVRTRHRFFGYDMKRGRNGIWYATGIFSTR